MKISSKKSNHHPKAVTFFKAIILLIVIAMLSIGITLIIYAISYQLQTPSSSLVGTADGWLGYFGGVIGGIMTLLGVWWTITDQDKKRAEDKTEQKDERLSEIAVQFRPIPQCSTVELKDPDGSFVPECKFHDGYIEIEFGLDIKNIGRGEIQSGHIKRVAYYTNLPELPTEIPLSEKEQPQKFIPASSNGCAKIHIPKIKLEYRKLVISAEYEYEDISSFSHTAHFDVFFYFNEFGKLDGIFYDTYYGKRDSFFPVDGSIPSKQNRGD